MAHQAVFRIAKKSSPDNVIAIAAKHNKRSPPCRRDNIDASKSHLNYSLYGHDTPEGVVEYAESLLYEAGIKPRKNGVKMVEMIFSLPADSSVVQSLFFQDCLTWVSEWGGILLSFDVHLDEANPHAHAIILPLVKGRMNGSDLVGGGRHFKSHQASFYNEVGRKHGIQKPKSKQEDDRRDVAREVLKRLGKLSDPCLSSIIFSSIHESILKDPYPYLEGIRLHDKTGRSGALFPASKINRK